MCKDTHSASSSYLHVVLACPREVGRTVAKAGVLLFMRGEVGVPDPAKAQQSARETGDEDRTQTMMKNTRDLTASQEEARELCLGSLLRSYVE